MLISRMGSGADVFKITAGQPIMTIRDTRAGADLASWNVHQPPIELATNAAWLTAAASRTA